MSEILDLDRELQARTGLARDDYSYVNPTISSPDRLFWNAYRPIIWVYHEDVPDHPLFLSEQDDEEKARALDRLGAPDLQDLETEYLHRLAELEPPVVEDAPDQVPGPDNHYGFYGPGVDQFLSALALSAARALALKRKHGVYSDDVRDCLHRARRAGVLLGIEDHLADEKGLDRPQNVRVRSRLKHGIVLLELSESVMRPEPAEALHLLVLGLEALSIPILRVLEHDPEGAYEFASLARYLTAGRFTPPYRAIMGEYSEQLEDNELEIEFSYASRGEAFVDYSFAIGSRLNPQYAADMIGDVLRRGREVDWKRVAEDCGKLTRDWGGLWDVRGDVVDIEGKHWRFDAYANYARGRAEERLSPDALRDLMREREEEQAEQRLRTYFFPAGLWELLPDRTRRALVDADRTWFSTRIGRVESVFEHLKVATEALCTELIWEPLRREAADPKLQAFRDTDADLRTKRHQPSLIDFTAFCAEPYIGVVVGAWKGTESDSTWLSGYLRQQLRKLNDVRNPATHDSHGRWDREQVRELYETFLGIGRGLGRSGVLPRLAEIKLHFLVESELPMEVLDDPPTASGARGAR